MLQEELQFFCEFVGVLASEVFDVVVDIAEGDCLVNVGCLSEDQEEDPPSFQVHLPGLVGPHLYEVVDLFVSVVLGILSHLIKTLYIISIICPIK